MKSWTSNSASLGRRRNNDKIIIIIYYHYHYFYYHSKGKEKKDSKGKKDLELPTWTGGGSVSLSAYLEASWTVKETIIGNISAFSLVRTPPALLVSDSLSPGR